MQSPTVKLFLVTTSAESPPRSSRCQKIPICDVECHFGLLKGCLHSRPDSRTLSGSSNDRCQVCLSVRLYQNKKFNSSGTPRRSRDTPANPPGNANQTVSEAPGDDMSILRSCVHGARSNFFRTRSSLPSPPRPLRPCNVKRREERGRKNGVPTLFRGFPDPPKSVVT